MVNHAGVAIGINHYQFLPPLSYGEADARALWQFLVNEVNLPSNQCLLFTDTSASIANQSTYPTRQNILNWLEANRQDSSPSANWRWFFFSGYGVSWENVDYLMPIDGNPNDIPGTGIPMRSLFASLNPSSRDNILVLLDINRSSGLQGGESVGAETLELAHEMGITLVLSSQLDQFSHETAALGHGLFTAALLEALRYYHTDTTLENLYQYLRDRLPELSQHHWQPIQTPVIVIPSQDVIQQLILPTDENLSVNEKAAARLSFAATPMTNLTVKESQVEETRNGSVPIQKTAASAVETRVNTSSIPTPIAATPSQTTTRLMAVAPSPNRYPIANTTGTPLWRQLLLWGGGAAVVLLLMLAAVALRVRDSFTQQALETVPTKTLPTTSPVPNTKALPTAAQGRLEANQADLEQAKRLIQPSQASLFSKAIVQARKVRPSDPLYQQAQQDISRWSGVILDLAEGRAAQKSFGEAIATAQLIPNDDLSVYTKAQQTVGQWKILAKQQQQNQAIIQQAKTQIQSNQASSYRRAIITLSKVSRGQPGYAEAQQLKERWSRTIYLIAQSRASQGNISNAIQTAALVPPDTSSSDAAQKAIAKWKQEKS
ncbi:MAG TPA: caspase family protein [Candidatus Sericytochromatia bacterium]